MGAADAAANVVPVLGLGVVEAEFEAVLLAGGGEFLERVAAERSRLGNVPVGGLRVEHGKAIVVLRGDDHVFHPGVPSGAHPFVGVELDRIKLLRVCAVFRHGDFATVHNPFPDPTYLFAVVSPGGDGIDAPVDEHAEPCRAPPGHPGVALGRGLVSIGIGFDDLGCALDVERDDRGHLVRGRRRQVD